MKNHKTSNKQPDIGGEELVDIAEAPKPKSTCSVREPEVDTSFKQRRAARLIPDQKPIDWTDAYEKFMKEIDKDSPCQKMQF